MAAQTFLNEKQSEIRELRDRTVIKLSREIGSVSSFIFFRFMYTIG